MTLRARLALALTFSALLPMGVAVGLPILQAERRAREDAARRLDAARKQAAVLIGRQKADSAARLKQVAADLAANRASRQPLLQGPAAAARSITRALAERYGLDYLEIRNPQGAVLARSSGGGADDEGGGEGLAFPPSELEEGEVRLRPLPSPAAPAESVPMAFFSRRIVALGGESLTLVGGRALGRRFAAGIAEITGEPAMLVDGTGSVVETAGERAAPSAWIEDEAPLGDGAWAVRVFVPAGDVREVRRGLVAAFVGVAPFAILSSLLAAMLLAAGIARPIRALAARAETIAAERAGGPLSPAHAEDEVGRLTLAFDQMLEALSQSERQRGAAEQIAAWQGVARRLAHEVKNPLSPIAIAVENLRRTRQKAPGDFDRAFEVETAAILEEVECLKRLVDEFTQFARMPRPQPAPCDLRQVVAQALQLLAPRIEALRVHLEVTDGGPAGAVRADAEQIGRALKNVLANALDALEPVSDRRLAVTLRSIAATPLAPGAPAGGASLAEIEVRDSGVGFTPDALRRVFEPYFTTRADRGGTGLGMAIAYRIITEHGGSIQASGAPGRGASVTMRLPVDGPAGRG